MFCPSPFYFLMNTPQLAARWCAAAVSLASGPHAYQVESFNLFATFPSTGTTLIFPVTTFFSFPHLYLTHTLYCVKMVDEYPFPAKILKLARSVIFS